MAPFFRSAGSRRMTAGALVAVAVLGLTACNGNASGNDASSSSGKSSSTDKGADSSTSKSKESEGSSEDSRSSSDTAHSDVKPSKNGMAHGDVKPSKNGMAHGDVKPSKNGMAHSDIPTSCDSDKLKMSLVPGDNGAGQVRYDLEFTNMDSNGCSMRGFPGVSQISKDGKSIGKPATHEGGKGSRVELAPSDKVRATLHTVNEGVSSKPCWEKAKTLKVYPPGQKKALKTAPGNFRVCGDTFTVSAVKEGATG